MLTLIGFVIGGSLKAQPSMMFGSDGTVLGVAVAAGLLYVNFQGFGVVTNASAAMAKPSRELPRALFIALSVETDLSADDVARLLEQIAAFQLTASDIDALLENPQRIGTFEGGEWHWKLFQLHSEYAFRLQDSLQQPNP